MFVMGKCLMSINAFLDSYSEYTPMASETNIDIDEDGSEELNDSDEACLNHFTHRKWHILYLKLWLIITIYLSSY